MKYLLLLFAVFCFADLSAQKISFHKDTVFADKLPYAVYHATIKSPPRDSLWTLSGEQIAALHSSRTEVKALPAYVLTFAASGRECTLLRDKSFPASLLREMMKYKVLNTDHSPSPEGELNFIKAHPLPAGYIDIDGHGENWVE
jgi:hypothetical protein